MTLASLPLFVRLTGRPVMLLGAGEAAAAKRRLLDRASAVIVDEAADAALAIVAIDDAGEAEAAVARLRARGILVNAVDRAALCDFTLPAIVDRAPVIVAIGTGGVSAGLAAALRQRLEALLPARLGRLAEALFAAREAIRDAYPDAGGRRLALAQAMAAGGPLDPLSVGDHIAVLSALDASGGASDDGVRSIRLRSPDPDDLTLREARWLASADRVTHRVDVPSAILDRARADAIRVPCDAPSTDPGSGLTIDVEMLR